MKSGLRKYLVILVIAFTFSGCKTVTKVTDASVLTAGLSTKSPVFVMRSNFDISASVVPFEEKRGIYRNFGSGYHYLIPLVPYGTIRYDRPDEARMFNRLEEAMLFKNINMSERLSRVVFNKLEHQKIFSNLDFVVEPDKPNTELILTGELYSTLYEGKTYSYGVSFLGPVLWCFGLPAGSSYIKLDLTLYLKKRSTNEVLWTFNLNKSKTNIQGLYYGKDISTYISLLAENIDSVINDLKLKLSQIPPEKLMAEEHKPSVEPLAVQLPARQEPSFSAAEITAASVTAKNKPQ